MEKKFEHILFVGPDYKNHKGGIGAVLGIYQQEIPHFNFVASYDGNNSNAGHVFRFLRSLLQITWLLLTNRKIKLVHIHGASKGSFYRKYIIFRLVKSVFRKKVIYHLHGGKFHLFYAHAAPAIRKRISRLVTSSDAVICLSASWKQFFTDNFQVKDIYVVKNPVAIPGTLPESGTGRQDRPLELLFLGRISDNKGIFDLLDVLKQYKDVYKGRVKLTVGGDGETVRLENTLRDSGLEEMVTFRGWVNGETKLRLFESSDIIMLPSHNEGLPIFLLEGMGYGKPVLSTTVGGIPELVAHNESGILITPGDKEALHEALLRMVEHPEMRLAMGEQSRKIAEEYDVRLVVNTLARIYAQYI